METNGKHLENKWIQWKPIEINMKTQVFSGNLRKTLGKHVFLLNLWKTIRKHRFSVGTYANQNENTGVPWQPNENTRKTHVFNGNL